jgi:acyl-CoA thioester hydrolase
MAKPDPALLDPARYPFHCRIEPRFGDLDVNLHINNVALAAMLEEAHVRFHRASGYAARQQGLSTMVASVTIDYLAQGSYPEPVDVHIAVERMGRTSHVLAKLATQGERPIGFSRAVLVSVRNDGPAPMPDAFVAQADCWELRP